MIKNFLKIYIENLLDFLRYILPRAFFFFLVIATGFVCIFPFFYLQNIWGIILSAISGSFAIPLMTTIESIIRKRKENKGKTTEIINIVAVKATDLSPDNNKQRD